MTESDAIQNRPPVNAYPPMVTFNDLIAQNKRNSAILFMGMMALAFVVVAVIVALLFAQSGAGFNPGTALFAGGLALVIVGLTGIWSYYGGAGAILAASGAQPIEKAQDPQLYNVVEELCLAGGIPVPAIYLIDDPALNAFATGRDPQHASVCVTTGLRQTLNREELQGVLGHELSHVRHYDIRTMMLAATMAGLIVMANGVLWNWIRWGGVGRRSRSSRDNNGQGIVIVVLFVVAILLAVLAPMMAKIIQLAISRQREYMADAGSVELTRDPDGLINALKKLGADDHDLATANAGTAHLFIVNPLHVASGMLDWDSAFSTHPPISERIARLEAMKR